MDWQYRRYSSFPYQDWNAFPPEAIVHVGNVLGDTRIGPAGTFWWGYEREDAEGVITRARRLDRPKAGRRPCAEPSSHPASVIKLDRS